MRISDFQKERCTRFLYVQKLCHALLNVSIGTVESAATDLLPEAGESRVSKSHAAQVFAEFSRLGAGIGFNHVLVNSPTPYWHGGIDMGSTVY